MTEPNVLPDLATADGASVASAPRRSRAWIVVLIVVIALVLCISCAVSGFLLFRTTEGTGTTGASPFGSMGGSQIGIVHLEGAISGTGGATPAAFHRDFDAALKSPAVKAIVLRVDSPGGTVAASQEMAEYVKRAEKPVVVSVGDLCASGGYMVASQADRIVALPGSNVGSIGVIMTVPNASEALSKLGIEMQVITSGENKDTGSMFRPLREDEIDMFRGEIDDIYAQFVGIVAEGRGMSEADVREIATGRTYLGDRALELGLVDEMGTLQDALQTAADLAGLEDGWTTRTFKPSPDLFTMLMRGGIFSPMSSLLSIPSEPAPQLR